MVDKELIDLSWGFTTFFLEWGYDEDYIMGFHQRSDILVCLKNGDTLIWKMDEHGKQSVDLGISYFQHVGENMGIRW